jgi:hypothetical protein
MKERLFSRPAIRCVGLLFLLLAANSFADLVQMLNGDRYVGKIVAMTNDVVLVHSDVLGLMKLPREKVAAITFGNPAQSTPAPAVAPAPAAQAPASATARTNTPIRISSEPATNAAAEFQTVFRQQPNSAKLMEQVKAQYLSEAGPEAQAKYAEMMSGLISGKLTVADIRREAKNAADQIRALKSELGEQAGGDLDGYLAILDHFLSEPGPVAPPAKKPAPAQGADEK